jgi:sterol desaturase/sphingolipid hydroxylase (fatty acid hydroxylase superfamily)
VFWFGQVRGRRSVREAAKAVFAPKVFLHPSALLDYRFIVVNHVLFVMLIGVMMLSISTTTGWVAGTLDTLFGPSPSLEAGLWTSLAYTFALFLATDFAQFFGHWIQHKIPVLWEFHKVHHSAEVLTPLTAIRVHPVSDILSTQVFALSMGLVNGAFLHVFAGPVAEITVLSVNALIFLHFTLGAYHLSHSHVWLMFPKGIREVVLSPAMHLIHHSSNPKHYDKNFALYLTLWDRLFGTLYVPANEEQYGLVLGVGEENADYRTVWQLYMTPFRKAHGLLLPNRSANSRPSVQA